MAEASDRPALLGVPGRGEVAGLVLAAGAGRRLGRPKALVEIAGTTLLERVLGVLGDAGCDPLLAVVGAESRLAAAAAVRAGAQPVVADDWASGQAASLRAGLAALARLPQRVEAAVVALVDQPLVTAPAVRRLVDCASDAPAVTARAGGATSPPVLLDRSLWAELEQFVAGDRGAGPWLTANADRVHAVDVADVADLVDVDDAETLQRVREWLEGNESR